jgi:hypothetical protein
MKLQRHKHSILCLALALTGILAAMPAHALPPDPDNAALLYYQAFISFPKSQDSMSGQLRKVAEGRIDPNEAVRDYVTQCAGVLKLTRAAAAIPSCTWGVRYSQGYDAVMPYLSQIRSLCFLVLTEARILASDGHPRRALENCLVCKQMTRHVGDVTLVSVLVGVAMDRAANQSLCDVLGNHPANETQIVWLKQELSRLSRNALGTSQALKTEQEVAVAEMRPDNPDFVQMLTNTFGDDVTERLDQADDAFYAANRAYFREIMGSVLATLNSPLPFAEKVDKLASVAERIKAEGKQDSRAVLTVALFPGVASILGRETEMNADNAALGTALGLYLTKAKTGKLPTRLPVNGPTDPYSGKPFIYEVTEDGFTLQCRAKAPHQEKPSTYRFQVP